MSTETVSPRPPIRPRPGVLKTLGVLNIVFAVLGGIGIAWSTFTMIAMTGAMPAAPAAVKVEVNANAAPKPGTPMVAVFNPMMGMNEPKFIVFNHIENGVSLVIYGLMFATGIGLLNLRRWAARGWAYLAWARIALLFLLWGYFVIGVAPAFSESMARNMVESIKQQTGGKGQIPTVEYMTQVTSIMCLIIAVGAIVVTSIYPAISLWLLSRPGVKAAIVDKTPTEPELP